MGLKYIIIYTFFILGSSASLKPSPIRLKPKTPNIIAKPGNVATQGALCRELLASLSIAPHSGVGGCAPNRKRLKAAASRIAVAILKVVCTIKGAIAFGNR